MLVSAQEEKSSSNATETKAMQVSTVSTNAETTSSYSVDFDLRNMVGFNDNAITANDIEEFIQDVQEREEQSAANAAAAANRSRRGRRG